MAALGIVVAVLEPWAPGAGALGLLVQGCVVAGVLLEHHLRLRPSEQRPQGAVEIRRTVPRSLDLGEPVSITLAVRNRLGVAVDVELVENLPTELETVRPFDVVFPLRFRVRANTTARVSYEIVPSARGPAPIPGPWLRVGAARGLALRRTRVDCDSDVRVVPALQQVVRYDTLRRSRNLAAIGIHVGAGFRRGREFDQLRDYHVDDDYRDIDWKATARRDRPITRVFRPERSQDVIVAVDASRTMTARAGGLSKLDRAVNAALVLAHVVTKGGDRCGLMVYDSEVRHWMPPSSGARTVAVALDTLHSVAPSPFDASLAAAGTAIAHRQTRRALVVFLTDLPDRAAGEDFVRCLPLLRARHLVACFTVSDREVVDMAERIPANARDLARTLAAAELLEEKRLARRRVSEAGAFCMELPPGELAASAVNRYLDAKARGLL